MTAAISPHPSTIPAASRWAQPTEAVPNVGWLGFRPMPLAVRDAAKITGVASLALGIGRTGSGWLDGLSRSNWFSGLVPDDNDLARAGGTAAGSIPASALDRIANLLPSVPMATVAIGGDTSAADHQVALQMIRAFRQRRDASRTHPTVIATLKHGHPTLAKQLAEQGAFVIEGAPGVPARHLHHFPLRAAVLPAAGRLVCADLADHLLTWRSGTCSRLHLLPAEADVAGRQLRRRVQDGRVGAGNVPLNLHVLSISWSTGNVLTRMEDLWLGLIAVLGRHPSGGVFTSTEPLTDMRGWADLLVAI